jgi:hypothetical protein
MLPRSALQTIAACMLYESDLPSSEKKYIIRFIEMATENQIKHYIVHGELVSDNRTQVSELGWILSSALISAASAAGRAIYNKFFSDAAQACRDKKGPVRKACMKNYKLRGVAGKISMLRREMGKCGQTAKPDKCRKMFIKYIRNADKQMRKIQSE